MNPLPQDNLDHHRRAVAGSMATELINLAQDLCVQFGENETRRVREGITYLIQGGPPAWPHPLQRPSLFFMPGIPPTRYFDPPDGSALGTLARTLEDNAKAVRHELLSQTSAAMPYLTDKYNFAKFQGVAASDWTAKVIYSDQVWIETVPIVQHTMLGFEEQISGEILVSALGPGKAIPPHVDDNNYKFTLQLGLSIPDGDCAIRVGGETRKWEEGRCIIFSDSFVHEVWNRTNQPRVVLLMDLWHPSLTTAEIASLRQVRKVLRPVCESSVMDASVMKTFSSA